MTVNKKVVHIHGLEVIVTENPGAPLMMLVRMAAHGMGLWDKIWPHLSEYYTVANFDLPIIDMDRFESPVALLKHYAQITVDIAKELGYDKFHIFGWTGGARVALRCLVDFPEHLLSCILLSIGDRPPDARAIDKNAEVVDLILEQGNLELYTYNWVLSSFSPVYPLVHFDEVKKLVDDRMEADRGRMDTKDVQKWIEKISHPPATDDELKKISVPTLLVTPGPAAVQRLHSLISSSEIAVIPGSRPFVLLEDPEGFMAAAGPFIRASARGNPLPAKLVLEEDSRLIGLKDTTRVQFLDAQPDHAIVFLHGWLMSPEIWAHTVSALSGKIRCISLWQPGHGRTSFPRGTFTFERWADWLIETLDSLNVKKAILVGHSMGGMLSMATVLKYPHRVKGLILVDTQDTAWDQKRNDEYLQAVKTLAVSWGPEVASVMAGLLLGEKFIKSHPSWLKSWAVDVAKYDLKGQIKIAGAIATRPDFSGELSKIRVPSLVVHGTVDSAIHLEIGREMAQRIPGAKLAEIPDAAHCPPLETPELFTEQVVEFLKNCNFIDN